MRILLIDASPLMFKVFTGPVQGFSTQAGEPTGLRFGFIRAVRAYEKKVKSERTVIVWDAHGADDCPIVPEIPVDFDQRQPPHRELLGASERGYKGNRDATREAAERVWSGVKGLRHMLSLTKYTQAWADGFEADDVIGALARQLVGQGGEIVIHSVDRDLWQLFANPRIVGWENDKKKGHFLGPSDVIDAFGVPPKHLLFYRAVEGDPSDNLRGCGLSPDDRGGLKLWLNCMADTSFHDVTEYRAAMRSGVEEKRFCVQTLPRVTELLFGDAERETRLRSNFDLMTLHTPRTVSIQKGLSDAPQLSDLFKSLEMKSLIPRVSEFAGDGPAVIV